MFKNEYIFLSPRFDIVRFKGSKVLVNRMSVKERKEEINLVTLGRNIITLEEAKFIKAKSVWKNFQEDDPEFLMKMLEQDLAFGKIFRLTKSE